MAGIPHPRVGMVGILSRETDHELLNKVAQEISECEVVFIGGGTTHSNLLHPRIRKLGMKPYDQIPAYIAALDVGLSVYRVTPATKCMDSMKVYEYLAAGKPVVATPSQEHGRKSPHVCVAADAQDFVAAVRCLVRQKRSPGESETLSQSVGMHDWSNRVSEMLNCLEDKTTGS
jgi:glycosyltransferase involved in cell wall biosynthesis